MRYIEGGVSIKRIARYITIMVLLVLLTSCKQDSKIMEVSDLVEDYNFSECNIVIRNSEGIKYDVVTKEMKLKVIEYLGSIKYSDITTSEIDGGAYYLTLKTSDSLLYIGLSSKYSITINNVKYKITDGYYPIFELIYELQIAFD